MLDSEIFRIIPVKINYLFIKSNYSFQNYCKEWQHRCKIFVVTFITCYYHVIANITVKNNLKSDIWDVKRQ